MEQLISATHALVARGTDPPVGFTDIPGALPDNGEILAAYSCLPDRYPAQLTLPNGAIADKLPNGLRYYIVGNDDTKSSMVNMQLLTRV